MGKYPLQYYRYLIGRIVNFLEDKPDIAEKLIDSLPNSEKEIARDIFNLY